MTESAISSFIPLPSSDVLKAKFVGKPITELPTPSILIDRSKLHYNCQQMLETCKSWNCLFRAHIKTLKTAQSTIEQVSQSKEKAIIVSTFAEAWGVIQSGLVKDGFVKDILFGVPLGPHKIPELLNLRSVMLSHAQDSDLKVIIDHPEQAKALQAALELDTSKSLPINVFIKIDCGYMRAGLTVDSPVLPLLVETIAKSSKLSIWGVYCHAGFSYDSKTAKEASSYLSLEMQSVNKAAELVNKISSTISQTKIRSPLVLSVGSTPTAHAAGFSSEKLEEIQKIKSELIKEGGELELHAGNYPVLDLQQVATNSIPDKKGLPGIERCALSVLATFITSYPSRSITNGNSQLPHADGKARLGDEAMVDGGGIAFAKDLGPIAGYGHLVWPSKYIGWQLGRVAQEHGIMTIRPGTSKEWFEQWGYAEGAIKEHIPDAPQIGDKVRIVPQHACMTAAAHPWFFVFDELLTKAGEVPTVVDVWIPWKGW